MNHSYVQTVKLLDLYNTRKMMKIMEKLAFLHEMLNIGPIFAQHWYNIILRNRVDRILLIRHRMV